MIDRLMGHDVTTTTRYLHLHALDVCGALNALAHDKEMIESVDGLMLSAARGAD